MNLKEAVKVCLGKKYADFSTRASRRECGFFFVFYFILCLALCVVNTMLGAIFEDPIVAFRLTTGVSVIVALLLIVPTYAVLVRRLHDTGRRGWWILLYFIPWIGTIALIIMLCQKSDEDNKYGPNP